MKKRVYFILLLLLITILVTKFIFIDSYKNLLPIFITITFPIITIFTYKLLGIQKTSKFYTKICIEITIIILLLYLILSNLSGLFFGFLENPLNISFISIIKNIYYFFILVLCEELIRYMVVRKKNTNTFLPVIIITILYIILDIIILYDNSIDLNSYSFFIMLTTIIIPVIARNIVSTFISYHVSYVPCIIFRFFFYAYIFVMPVFPDYGDYITSMIGIILPYLLYVFTIKYINKYEKTKELSRVKKKVWYFNIPIFSVLILLILLISGVGKYQIIAVGSGSMSPKIKYGDAVIIELSKKDDSYLKVKLNDIIAFRHDNQTIVHKVNSVSYTEDDIVIKTKGDANKTVDKYTIEKKDIVGIVKLKINYIGYPTLIVNDIFKRK